jgi:hypothetical protein
VLNVFLFGIGIWGWGIIKNEELRMRNEKLVKVRSEKWEKVG